jgi:hypothetical protein
MVANKRMDCFSSIPTNNLALSEIRNKSMEEMNTPAKEWREALEKVCKLSGIGMCPGCGLTPEGLEGLLTTHSAHLVERIEKVFDSHILMAKESLSNAVSDQEAPYRHQYGRLLQMKQELLDQHSAQLVERGNKNAVIKEYKDEGAMFVLKVEDGKTYEASMPIPKWHEVGKLEYRTPSTKP